MILTNQYIYKHKTTPHVSHIIFIIEFKTVSTDNQRTGFVFCILSCLLHPTAHCQFDSHSAAECCVPEISSIYTNSSPHVLGDEAFIIMRRSCTGLENRMRCLNVHIMEWPMCSISKRRKQNLNLIVTPLPFERWSDYSKWLLPCKNTSW